MISHFPSTGESGHGGDSVLPLRRFLLKEPETQAAVLLHEASLPESTKGGLEEEEDEGGYGVPAQPEGE